MKLRPAAGLVTALALAALCIAPACRRAASVSPEPAQPPAPGAAALGDSVPGIHNLFAVAPGVYSGSGPQDAAAFDSLADLGVRTVISVDGARPEIEQARARGMRYVHIPIGYDGLTPEQALEISNALQSTPGPVYVHCHHGKHRGPTAAAVALVGLGRISNAQAAAFMRAAGTAESYPGLWACAREQPVYSEAELALAPAEFPEVRKVSGLVEGMVAIDETWERIKLVREAGWAAPPDHPDIAPAAEAGILADHMRVLVDDPDSLVEGPAFVELMHRAAERASALEGSMTRVVRDERFIEQAYRSVAASCVECHDAFRN